MSENTRPSINDALNPQKFPPAKFFSMKDRARITGTLEAAYMRQATFDGDKLTYKNGEPKYEIVLVLADTDAPRDNADPEEEGRRKVSVAEYGPARDALTEELQHKGFVSKDEKGRERTDIAKALGHRLTVAHTGEAPRQKGASRGQKLLSFDFHSGARDSVSTTLNSHNKETREDKAPRTTRDVLAEYGLPAELAPLLGDHPTKEMLEALRNQYGK